MTKKTRLPTIARSIALIHPRQLFLVVQHIQAIRTIFEPDAIPAQLAATRKRAFRPRGAMRRILLNRLGHVDPSTASVDGVWLVQLNVV